jgi:hypothetical protein
MDPIEIAAQRSVCNGSWLAKHLQEEKKIKFRLSWIIYKKKVFVYLKLIIGISIGKGIYK